MLWKFVQVFQWENSHVNQHRFQNNFKSNYLKYFIPKYLEKNITGKFFRNKIFFNLKSVKLVIIFLIIMHIYLFFKTYMLLNSVYLRQPFSASNFLTNQITGFYMQLFKC